MGPPLPEDPDELAPDGDAITDADRQAIIQQYERHLLKLTPSCRCQKSRYRTEGMAVAAAAQAATDLNIRFTVYRCPGYRCWHKASRGFHPEALKSTTRLIAYYVSVRQVVDKDWLQDLLISTEPSDQKRLRYRQVLSRFLRQGLIYVDSDNPRLLRAGQETALQRVIQIGFLGWRAEQAAKRE